jgi:hypothetical protein
MKILSLIQWNCFKRSTVIEETQELVNLLFWFVWSAKINKK